MTKTRKTPAQSVPVAPAPKPERPREGGAYIRDRHGRLTRAESVETVPAETPSKEA